MVPGTLVKHRRYGIGAVADIEDPRLGDGCVYVEFEETVPKGLPRIMVVAEKDLNEEIA